MIEQKDFKLSKFYCDFEKTKYYNFCKVSTEAMAILGLSAQLGKVVWT